MRPQVCELLICKCKQEVRREPAEVSPNLLVQPLGCDAIDERQIGVEQHPLPPDVADISPYIGYGGGWRRRRHTPSINHFPAANELPILCGSCRNSWFSVAVASHPSTRPAAARSPYASTSHRPYRIDSRTRRRTPSSPTTAATDTLRSSR